MWWIALVAAVGAALLAGCLGCGVFLLWRRKYGHGRKGGAQGAADQASMIWPTQRDLTWACSILSLYSSGAICRVRTASVPVGAMRAAEHAPQAGVILQSIVGDSSVLGWFRHDVLRRRRLN